MKQKSIQKNAIYNIIKTTSTVIFPLITFPYVTRVLQADGIGKINFVHSIVSYFALIASLGLSTYAIRECANIRKDQQKLNQIASELFSINVITCLIAYLFLGLALLFGRSLQEYRTLIIIQSSTILFSTLGTDWINSAMEDFQYITLRTLGFQLLSVILLFCLVKTPEDYLIYMIISVVCSSAPCVLNIFYRRKYCRVRFTLRLRFKQHITGIIWLFVMLLSQNIFNQADITMLGLIHTEKDVGLYSTAIKIYTIINQVITSVLWVVLPRLSIYHADQNKDNLFSLQRKTLGFIIVLGLPCAVGIFCLAEEVLLIVGGEAFLAAAPTLRILMLSLLFSLFGGGFFGNIVMLPAKREKFFMVACCVAAVVNVGTNWLLIPHFGIVAAAATTAFSELILLVLLAIKAKGEVHIGSLRNLLLAPLIGCALIVFIVEILSFFVQEVWLRTILSVGIAALGYVIVVIMFKNEIAQQILTFVKKRIFKK